MRTLAIATAFAALLALDAAAGDFFGSAELGYQNYEYGSATSSGFRQTYDLQLRKTLNATSVLRVFVRADKYSGNGGALSSQSDVDTSQLQPGAELTVNTEKLTLSARSEVEVSQSTSAGSGSLPSYERRIERTTASAEWRPDRLPFFNFNGHRYVTEDDIVGADFTDEMVGVRGNYPWRGFWVAAEGREAHRADLVEGYDRNDWVQGAEVGYAKVAFGERLSVDLRANARHANSEETGLDADAPSVPTALRVLRAANGVDETPADNRDKPLAPNPALIDGELGAGAGIPVGPDGESFNNIALEFGRPEPVDEIQIIVRDERGDPIRIGGGAVQWDVWTSEDGIVWLQLPGAITTYNGPRSLYSVTFEQLTKRWIKVVNFGVNIDTTLVTEVEAFYHREIAPGGERSGIQEDYAGVVNVIAHPLRRMTLSYSGSYVTGDQTWNDYLYRSSTSLQQIASAEYNFRAPFALRGLYTMQHSEELDGFVEDSAMYSAFVDWLPTSELRLSAEYSRQDQTFEGGLYLLETRALHLNSSVLPSVLLIASAGQQQEAPETGDGSALRDFFSVSSDARLTRSLRLVLTGSLQRVTPEDGYTSRFLGAGRDDRVNADFIWRPGRQLAVTASAGWFRGESRDGTTGRLRVEWYPFGDGTVVVGAWVDEDVDSVSDRQATRGQFLARWSMNRYARFEVNYTAVSTTIESATNEQRTLFATLTLTN